MEKKEEDYRKEYKEYLQEFVGLAYKPISYEEWRYRF